MKKQIKRLVAIIISITTIFTLFGCSKTQPTVAKIDESLYENMYNTPYYMDKSGDYVANIPYDKYLQKESANTGKVFDIRKYGADTKNSTLDNTIAINKAVVDANKNGGGTVYVTGGQYSTSTVTLLSNVTLKIAKDSSLLSVDCDENKKIGKENKLKDGFIRAIGAENVTIEGPGKLLGNGLSFMKEREKDYALTPEDESTFNLKEYNLAFRKYIYHHKDDCGRVNLIRMNDCKNVKINNVIVQEPGDWTLRIQSCENVEVTNVVFNNNVHSENADGVNYVGCKNVKMNHCFVTAADDGICLKAYKDNNGKGCYDYDIHDCEVMSIASCFKVGTPTANEVKNIEVYDCKFFRAGIMGGYAGISLESADGTNMDNVYIHDIDMDQILSPVLIWLGKRLDNGGDKIGSVKNIKIENITANNVDLPSAIVGCRSFTKRHNIENVELKNFTVTYREAKEDLDLPGAMEYFYAQSASVVYPEITRVIYLGLGNYEKSVMQDYPVYGLYCRYVDGLTVDNFNVKPRSCNTRPFDNITNESDRFAVKNVTIK